MRHPPVVFLVRQDTHRTVLQVVASLGYALMKFVGCVALLFLLPWLLPLQKNELTLRPGWTNLPTFRSVAACECRTRTSLTKSVSGGSERTSSPALFNLSKRDTLRNNRKKGLIEFFRVANFVFAERPVHVFHISHRGPPSFCLWICTSSLKSL